MNDTHLRTPEAVREFLQGAEAVDLSLTKKQRYAWLSRFLKQTNYSRQRKRDKSTLREYMQKMTGYSRQQLTRLIAQYRTQKWIGRKKVGRGCFPKKYMREDILLLACTDEAHQTLSGGATKKLFERAYEIYQQTEYERLAGISIAHIYNLRKSQTYQHKRQHFTKTRPTGVNIGERRKPHPEGQPGYLRIDSVHQGDLDKRKGVYHINAVDDVTQHEMVCAVQRISECYLMPTLEVLLGAFPFEIKGFHSDNGSEYINDRVAKLLQKLHIEFTKSRARQSNDNALVESKNGAVVRKHMGYEHIPQKWASEINIFYLQYLNPYLNYHRPCYYPRISYDNKGKQKKTYPYKDMMTPYEKFKSLDNATQYLKAGVSFKDLDLIALAKTDLQAAQEMKAAKARLFKKIFEDNR